LSIEVGLEDLLSDGRGGRPAAPCVLDQNRDRDLRVHPRREADEPRVVAKMLGPVLIGGRADSLSRRHLGGARLARDRDALEPGSTPPSRAD
jgi:hypothetical protein